MAVEAITWVLKSARGIKAGPRCVLLVLANYSDAEGWCYPSAAHIAETVEMKRDTVYQSLRKLEDAGLITREKHPGQRSRYRVHWAGNTRKTGRPEKRADGARKTGIDSPPKTGTPLTLTPKGDTKVDTKGKSGPPSWSIDDYELDALAGFRSSNGSGFADVHAALQRWLDYRKLVKRKYVTSGWIAEVWKRLDKDPARLVAAVEVSIAREWQGIYEANGGRGGGQKRHAAPAWVDPATRKIKTRRTS